MPSRAPMVTTPVPPMPPTRIANERSGRVIAGSGSTLRAADIEGFDAIGIEQNPEYVAIAKARVDGDMPLFQEVA